LPPDYHENLGKGFDGLWLRHAGVTHEQMVDVVRNSITDGQICDWVRQNVVRSSAEKAAHRAAVLDHPKADDPAMQQRLRTRKEEGGLAHRDDIRTFVDYIDADERRL
jgi:hypothetical protein